MAIKLAQILCSSIRVPEPEHTGLRDRPGVFRVGSKLSCHVRRTFDLSFAAAQWTKYPAEKALSTQWDYSPWILLGISFINGTVSKRRSEVIDVYSMEDSDYRDMMREDLARARKRYGKRSNHTHTGSIVISMILLVAGAAVIMHHLGMITLPK
jgi:hypothetical protein